MIDPSARVHPSAILEGPVRLGAGVEVGPYCVLRGDVEVAAGARLVGSVTIQGPVRIGTGTQVYPGACIGFEPQDVKFKPGMPTAGVRVGANTLIREHVTLHAATKTDAPTSVGDNCFLMVGVHLGHDASIGNNVTLVNSVLLAGHVRLGDSVTIGGDTALHQFCRVGRLAMITGGTGQSMDIPPFCLSGARNQLHGINAVGLRRAGVAREEITLVRKAFRAGFAERLPRAEMLARVAPIAEQSALVREFYEFLATPTKRGIAEGRMALEDDEPVTA